MRRGAPARPAAPARPRNLVLFDGHCALCDGTVRWLVRLDRRGRLTFAPLQGETAQRLGLGEREPSSLAFLPADGAPVLTRSRAVLAILGAIGGPARLLAAAGRLLPTSVADRAYDAIARRRLAWFGRPRRCHLPAAGDAGRFLP